MFARKATFRAADTVQSIAQRQARLFQHNLVRRMGGYAARVPLAYSRGDRQTQMPLGSGAVR
jgi:hypothetical protein